MADKLRPDELAAFKAAFDMFDKNQDGTISTKVCRSLINSISNLNIGKFVLRYLSGNTIFFIKIYGKLFE